MQCDSPSKLNYNPRDGIVNVINTELMNTVCLQSRKFGLNIKEKY